MRMQWELCHNPPAEAGWYPALGDGPQDDPFEVAHRCGAWWDGKRWSVNGLGCYWPQKCSSEQEAKELAKFNDT